MSTFEDLWEELIVYVSRLQTINYFGVAGAALLVYDYTLTFELEVRYVWFAPWNVGKLLYFVARYLPFMDVPPALYHQFYPTITLNMCHVLYNWNGWSFLFGIGLSAVILAMRTWAIRGCSRTWAVILVCFWLAVFIPSGVVTGRFLASLDIQTPVLPAYMPGCFVEGANNTLFSVSWLLAFAYEFFIFVVTASKGVELWRAGTAKSALIGAMFRDGLLFSFCTCSVSAINAIVSLAAPEQYSTLLTVLQRVLHSIFATRILLHLREEAGKNITGEEAMSMFELQASAGTAFRGGGESYVNFGNT